MLNVKKISKSGSVTIPAHIRRDLGIDAADQFEIVAKGDGNLLLERTMGSCFICKAKTGLMKVDSVLICKDCGKRILEKMEG